MQFGSVCSGIEAASVAWHPLGWRAAWVSEIEPFPCAVLAHHYPGVANLGDMTTLPARILSGEISAPDIFCGGTPCQAFSVAGLRRSLDDARGNLSLVFCEIANAIDAARRERGILPSVIFWENVPGVLSTKDNAFGCFLAGLAGEDAPLVPPGGRWTNAGFVDGPARAVAWRVLDAQYFGLAQRRKRVFVVASARADFDPAAVLFEFKGVRRDTAPRRETRKVAPTIPPRSSAGGGLGTDFDCDGGLIQDVAGTLEASLGRSRGAGTPTAALQPYEVANCLTQRMYKGINTTLDEGQTPVLAIDGEFNSASHVSGPITTGAAHSNRGTMVAHAFAQNQCDEVPVLSNCPAAAICANEQRTYTNEGSVFQLRNVVGQPVAIQDVRAVNKAQNGRGWNDDGTAYTVDTYATQGVAFQQIADCLTSAYGTKWNGNASADNGSLFAAHGTAVAPSLTASNDPSRSPQSAEVTQQVNAIYASSMQVRRLTPVECERLQGFPDNYTNIPWRGKPESPDGPRYKALGNSWAVPVVRWVGARIQHEIIGDLA